MADLRPILLSFFEAIQELGMFWGVLNETPPRGTLARLAK
jgi:hypothetical protein